MLVVVILLFSLAAFLAVLGVVMFCGHGASLVAGYNTASPEKRARIDEKKMLRRTGAILLATSLALALDALGALIGNEAVHWIGAGLVCVIPIAGAILMNVGKGCNKK